MSINPRYEEWIKDFIDWEFVDMDNYTELLDILATTPYEYIVPRDENRLEDGANLRWQYQYYGHINMNFPDEVSVLEVLVALCDRAGCYRDPEDIGNPAGYLFWHIIENLGLMGMTDSSINYTRVYDVLDDWMTGNYDCQNGGIFCIPGYKGDITKLELWLQMDLYLDLLPDKIYY